MDEDISIQQFYELAAGSALGDLDAEEVQKLDQILQTYPELQGEIEHLQATLAILPQGLPQLIPSPGLEAKVQQQVDAILATSAPSSQPSRSHRFRRSRFWWVPASVVAILAMGLVTFDNLRLRQTLQLAQETAPPQLEQFLQQPNARLVSLQGEESTDQLPSGSMVFVAGEWQVVIIALKNLPPPPADQIYRVWAEFSNGEVILCGEFMPDAEGTVLGTLEPRSLPAPGTQLADVFITLDPQSTGDRILSKV